MIFGDPSLFDNAPLGTELVGHSGGFYKNSPDGPIYCGGCTFTTDEYRNIGFIAARRVIAEPKPWTIEDQKAGRLPEVGSLIMEVESQYGFEFVGVCAGSKRFAVKDVLDGLIYFYNKDVISPIETPAEKAQRFESEWVESAFDAVMIVGVHSTEDIQRIKNHLRTIYRAQLSGELAAPKGGE